MKVVVQVIKTEFMLGYTVQGMFTRDMIDSFIAQLCKAKTGASGAGTPGEERWFKILQISSDLEFLAFPWYPIESEAYCSHEYFLKG